MKEAEKLSVKKVEWVCAMCASALCECFVCACVLCVCVSVRVAVCVW